MNRYSALRHIQDIATSLQAGESTREVCPLCNGGSTREKSLVVKRSNETSATFICFRNSCSLGSGHIAIFSDNNTVLTAKSRPCSKELKEPDLYPLSQAAIDHLRSKYWMTDPEIVHSGVRLTFDQRLALPVFTPTGRIAGLVIRKEKELYRGRREYSTIPKVWNFVRDKDNYCGSWYHKHFYKRKYSDTLIIVEDILSAVRLAAYSDSVAITGTNLLRPVISHIKQSRYDKVWLALDNDAIKRAFSLVRRFQSELPHMNVMGLQQDFKNMSSADMQQVLTNYKVIEASTVSEQGEEVA